MAQSRLEIVAGVLVLGLGISACGDQAPFEPVGAAGGEGSSTGSSTAPVEGVSRTNLGAHRPEYLAPLLSNLNQCTTASYLEDDETGTWGWTKGSSVLELDAVLDPGAGAGDVSKLWYLRFDPESERKVIFEAQCIIPAVLGAARRASAQLNRTGPRTGRRQGGTGLFFAEWGDPDVYCTYDPNWDLVECEGTECVRSYFAPPVGSGAPAVPSGTTVNIAKEEEEEDYYGTWTCESVGCELYISLVSQDYSCEGEGEGEGEGGVCVELEPEECEGGGGGGGGGSGGEPERPSTIDVDDWEEMNTAEKARGALNPIECLKYVSAAKNALAWAAQEANGQSAHNNEFDAMRHTYWSALLTRELDAERAEIWTDAHESTSEDPEETCMDQHNNGVGRTIGVAAGSSATDAQLQAAARDARDGGQLRLTPGGC